MTLLCAHPEWVAEVVDVEGAFLQGRFTDGEVLHTQAPDGMTQYYGEHADTVLLLNVQLYGTKQAAHCFYAAFVKAIKK